jgi:hypothetical protein
VNVCMDSELGSQERRKPRTILTILILAIACGSLLPHREALALKAGANGTTTGGDACTEMFHDCLRGCGSPGSNPACEKYCEEQVFAKCKGSSAAIRGRTVSPGAVNALPRK